MVAWSDNIDHLDRLVRRHTIVPYRAGFRSMRRLTLCGFGGWDVQNHSVFSAFTSKSSSR